MGFESFIGNRKTVDRIRMKLREGRFPHSLTFAGADGVGKRTFALMIAKTLNCSNPSSDDFCGECHHCRKINSGNHPDVITLTVEEEATQIKIGQIRLLLATLQMRPLEGRNKVFIVDPANLLNLESANALLKGLEEPPANSFFFLLTVNLQELLLTIRSRCQIYHFSPLALDDIRAQGITDELAVRWSRGSIGKALSLSVGLVKEQRETIIQFIEAAVNAKDETFREMLAASADLARARRDFSGYLSIMAVVLGDILYISEGARERVVNVDILQRIERLAASAPTARWLKVSEFLRVMESGLRGNVNRQMLTDAMALETADITDDNAGVNR